MSMYNPETHRRIEVSRQRGEHLRKKLLDLSARNNLISFRHDPRRHDQVRVIDELLDILYQRMTRRRDLQLRPLPDPMTFDDEATDFFRERLEQACYSDPEFLRECKDTEGKQDVSIRNRIAIQLRQALGWPDQKQRHRHEQASVARLLGLDPDFELPYEEQKHSKHEDNLVQTLLFPEDFDRKLAGLYRKQRLILSETGVSALYAAFGFLQWSPQENNEETYSSPLLLVPINLLRESGENGFSYVLQARDDEVLVNPSLGERLTRDFGLVLPELRDDHRPELYLAAVNKLIGSRKNWCVQRFLTIGLFSFSRIAMYKDLSTDNWSGRDGVWNHPVVLDLLAGRDVDTIAASFDEAPINTSQIRELPLVANADASQSRAILEVLAGRNLVIEGPPGTGKSQTITNIIAACMARGKRVLFVAEKMAALEVVHKRLEHVGLGPFCLELHSAKANKKRVMSRLKQSLNFTATSLPKHNNQWLAADRLDSYSRLLHRSLWHKGPSGYQLIWRLAHLEKERPILTKQQRVVRLSPGMADPEAWRLKMRDAIATYAQAWQAFVRAHGSPADHPWCGLEDPSLDVSARQRLCQKLVSLLALLRFLNKNLGAFANKLRPNTPWNCLNCAAFFKLIDQIGARMAGRTPELALFALSRNRPQLARVQELLDVANESQQLLANIRKATPAFDPDQPEPVTAQLQRLGELIGDMTDDSSQQTDLKTLCILQRKRVAGGHNLVRFARDLCDYLGLKKTLNVALVKQACQAVSLAAELPDSVRELYLPALLQPGCHQLLVKAKKLLDSCLAERRSLEKLVALDNSLTVTALRKAAKRLEKVSFLNAWTPSSREARATWTHVGLTPDRLSYTECGQVLSRLATYLKRASGFCANKQFQQLCGPHFAGLDTPLADLLLLNEWALRVAKNFLPMDPARAQPRHFLLETDAAALIGLAALQQKPEWTDLQTLLGEADRDETILADLVTAREHRLQCLEEARVLAAELGWSCRVPISEAGVLAVDAVRFSLLARRLDEGRDLFEQLELTGRGQRERLFACTTTAHDLAAILALEPPPDLVTYLFDHRFSEKLEELKTLSHACSSSLETLELERDALLRAFVINDRKWCGGTPWNRAPLEKLATKIERALKNRGALDDLCSFLDFEAELARAGLGELIGSIYDGAIDATAFVEAFDYAWLQTALEQAFQLHPKLKSFGVGELEKVRRLFASRDRVWIGGRGKEIATEIRAVKLHKGHNKGPKKNWTGLALLKNEVEKMARHVPIRELLSRAGKTVQQLAPCFLMSPLSVAQFLGPGTVDFDLVIMDEASQMRPQDAISAIARGRQLVVVGDPKQLGPTSFFQAANQGDEDDLENLIDESILEMALKNFVEPCRLKWHYRSRHPSLISCSNRLFYDDDLVVFPSPRPDDPHFGFHVRFVYDGVYHKGANPGEADAVIRAAFTLMKTEPGTSLGIVSVNQAQQELIEEKLDTLFTNQAVARDYLKKWQDTLEPPFVKNLENVQGDERDVILVSVVYGRDKQGQFYRRFGPINRKDGQRRLNVLFTRARQRLELFTSMKPEWIKLDKKTGAGVRALRAFLEQTAQSERVACPSTTDFAGVISERLRDLGYSVELPQSGYGNFVALAIRDPAQPEVFLMGINGDAAGDGPFAAVRDRERLRGEVLTRMGWRLHRIWSVDWARDPEAVWQVLLKELKAISAD